jgi:tetratricopeptide (TPR) repeat protein
MYEKWNHFAEAEYHYNKIIRLDYPGFVSGYYLLWNMMENMGRYKDAENVIRNLESVNPAAGQPELNAFYKRMIKRLPENGDWYYKAGLFLYRVAAASPNDFLYDKKKTAPDTHLETYIISAGNGTVPSIVLHSHEQPILLASINEFFTYAEDITYPRTDGIVYFKKADSLLQADDDAIADINYKMGDLYVWQGVPQDAIARYKKSIELKPDNANTRLKLVDIYNGAYQFQNALQQLDSLYRRKEINFDKQVLLARYYIHESRFTEAGKLLSGAKQIHPYKIAAIIDLNGRLQLLSKQLEKALAFYKDYLTVNPADASAYYTIARINAQSGNGSEAYHWLEMAMQKGFNFGWVLQLDTAWNGYGKQNRWIDLQKKIRAKVYTEGH